MSAVNELLSQFSLEEVFIFIILIFMVVKVMGELFDYFYKKLKDYFGQKDEAEERTQKILSRLDALEQSSNDHYTELKNMQASAQLRNKQQIEDMRKKVDNVFQRMQASEKFYILEKIQNCEQEGYVSTSVLQDLLSRYENYTYYDNDTFLSKRIKDVQELPKI